MKPLVLTFLAVTIFAVQASAARFNLDTAGTNSLEGVPDTQWSAMAQKEIAAMGVVGIQGGVIHTVPQNQRSGEDCWSFALNVKIESFIRATNQFNPVIKLAPEYVEFWHIYNQIETHLDDFATIVAQIKKSPGTANEALEKLKAAYKLTDKDHRRARKSKTEDALDNLFQPDVGNEASTAIDEIEKYGIAPYRIVKVEIKTDDQEDQLENAIANLTGQIIIDAVNAKTDLATYRESGDGINEALFQVLKGKLEPIMKTKMIRPTDTWTYQNQSYTPLTLLAAVHHIGLDLKNDFRPLTTTPSTHAQALKAIAISLLTDNQPVPIGITLFADELNSAKKTDTDFAEKTGLFTDAICPAGGCVSEDGGHEVLVVNFLAKFDGDMSKLSAQDKIAKIQSGALEITGLVIQNSWGVTGGLDINGQALDNNHQLHGGFYVLTSDFLLNSGAPKIGDMYDFVLPASVAKQFPKLKKSDD